MTITMKSPWIGKKAWMVDGKQKSPRSRLLRVSIIYSTTHSSSANTTQPLILKISIENPYKFGTLKMISKTLHCVIMFLVEIFVNIVPDRSFLIILKS